ncbi:hypothetical protein SAMN05421753_104240 [Planctomicrobium piriforme]|uniref:Uncharacterized protein n=1 Tax=Planctomicrobium piriforme TaxID=1576369 RepID=A0A1I3EIP6_9PLAN|nr:hypothetical protein SAMN05421753_104240 [Planctomicrobium piriforme]
MSADLAEFTSDQLIEELINREGFIGIVIFHRAQFRNVTQRPLAFDSNEVVLTKSPPLTREGVEALLATGQELLQSMFGG